MRKGAELGEARGEERLKYFGDVRGKRRFRSEDSGAFNPPGQARAV